MTEKRSTCAFCGSSNLKQTHSDLYHPGKSDHGPFEFHQCLDCGSGLTLDPPTSDALGALYGSFKDGLPDLHREIMKDDPQYDLYRFLAKRLLRFLGARQSFRWLDIGAGGGELSLCLSELAPKSAGTAIDLHPRASRLESAESVEWIQHDINAPEFAKEIGLERSADAVVSTAVWEHVSAPDRYARNLISLLKPGGVLYMMCPNYGSLAAKVMGESWPYFTPGEHLNMPTPKGAAACLRREWRNIHPEDAEGDVRSVPIALPYSFRYVLRRFRIDALGRLIPPAIGIGLPSGALEAVLIAPSKFV